jgi:hypothetical protein
MAIRFVIEPTIHATGQSLPEQLWEDIVTEYFFKFDYIAFSGIKIPEDFDSFADDYEDYNSPVERWNLVNEGELSIFLKWPNVVVK